MTTQQAKEEAIREAYGYRYETVKEYIDEKGRCRAYFNLMNEEDPILCKGDYWRPKSLSGIEDNRGWIRIESEEDLPNEKGEYKTCLFDVGVFKYPTHSTTDAYGVHKSYKHGLVTHYRKIDIFPQPIY